ncbi:MAG TPA: glycine cleavage system protein GcvH [Rhabdochlamydiaceae bacterium]
MKFTESHEWIKVENGIGTVGITHHAQKELGDVVYIELPMLGKLLKKGEEAAVLESTKAAADVYTPVSGEIVEINQNLSHFSEKVNAAPETEGWLFKVKLTNPSEADQLLNLQEYLNLIS